MRAAALELKVVVIGRSVAEQFGGLEELARMDSHFLVDARPEETGLQLLKTGADSALYYGGLEEAQLFQRMVAGAVRVTHRAPTQGPFLAQMGTVLRLAGVPEPMIRAGLEEFAARLESVDVGV